MMALSPNPAFNLPSITQIVWLIHIFCVKILIPQLWKPKLRVLWVASKGNHCSTSMPILFDVILDPSMDIPDFLYCPSVLYLTMNGIITSILVLSEGLTMLDVLAQAMQSIICFTLSQFEFFCSQSL
jgi:hypothetical protein